MQITILILSALSLLCAVIILIRSGSSSSAGELSDVLTGNQREIGRMQSERFDEITRSINDMSESLDRRLDLIRRETGTQLENLRKENTSAIDRLRTENSEQLDRMQKTVDENKNTKAKE